MKRPTQFLFYYFLFAVCLIGVYFNYAATSKLVLYFWIGLAVILFLFFRRSRSIDKSIGQAAVKKEALRASRVTACIAVYRKLVAGDESFSVTELDQINADNLLAADVMEGAKAEARKACLHELVRDSLSGGVLSPANYALIFHAAKRLDVNLQMSEETLGELEKMKRYWEIENGILTAIPVDILLPHGEICYFTAPCTWYEHHSRVESAACTGISASFKIAPGVRYRVGAFAPRRFAFDSLTEIDKGQLFLTSHRLLFTGGKKSMALGLDHILSFTPYTDGIEVGKDSGKNPVLVVAGSDLLAHLITRLKQ